MEAFLRMFGQRCQLLWLFGLILLVACGGEAEVAAVPTATVAPPTETAVPPTPTATLPPPTATEPAETAVPEATDTPIPTPTNTPTPTAIPILPAPRTFAFDPTQTEVRFQIDEELLGNPKTVIGVTNAVTGEIQVDPDFANQAELSEIRIDASTLATDEVLRNRSIRQFILQTTQPEFQFITFAPTELVGLPEVVAEGESVTFDIVGDLTIRDITQATTFSTTVTLVDANTLMGLAETIVLRADYDLSIPSVPGVANVAEEVLLQISFVAIVEE